MVRPFESPCRAPLWARGGQAQTLLGFFLRSPGEVLDERSPGVTRVEVRAPSVGAASTPDDRLVVFDAAPLAPPRGSAWEQLVVHLFHGLTGSSESNYMRLAARVLREAGATVRLFNHRGQGAGEGLARGLYHSGSWPDLFASIADARARDGGGRTHIAVGFSLSANTALLGASVPDARDHPGHPDAVLAVNPPVDLSHTCDAIAAGFNRVYDRNFVRGMRAALEERTRAAPGVFGEYSIPSGATVRAADDAVTAPLAGYRGAEEYYSACSSGPRLAGLRAPAVLLTSADDPFVAASEVTAAVERAREVRSPSAPPLHLHVERTGGHLGYLDRTSGRWLARALRWYVGELAAAAHRS